MIGQQSAGSAVGHSLGAALSQWLGAGDYEVSKNSLVARASAGIPMMHKTQQSVVVRHREFIGAINGSVGFNVAYALPINPGLNQTFPWLSRLAGSFQEYSLKGMVYHYVPTSGAAVASTNSALGSVMIQTSYRSSDTPPGSKVEMLNEYWANEVVPCDTMCHPIECDPKENPFAIHYVRTGPIPSGEPLMYDQGITFVCTQGMQATNQVGDLWVTYEVELKKPIVSSNVTELSGYFTTQFGGGTNTALFNSAQSATAGNLVLSLSANTITIPAGLTGIFLIQVAAQSTAGLTNPTGFAWSGNPTLTNCTLYTAFGSQAVLPTVHASPSAVFINLSYATAVIKADTSAPATITIPAPAMTAGSYQGITLSVANLGLA
jgi:hypothetical protein